MRHLEFQEFIELIAQDLITAGLKIGDHVIVIAPYTWKWMAVELAILRCGGVVVGVDVRESQDFFDQVRAVTNAGFAITDDRSTIQHLSGTHDLMVVEWEMPRFGNRIAKWPSVCDNHRATVVFTSGTTGQPKGIPYTHGQVIYAIEAIICTFSQLCMGKERVISWLPLNHLFQRIINLVCIKKRASIYFLSDHKQMLKAMHVARPTIFLGVPQFYEFVADNIRQRVNGSNGMAGAVLRYLWNASTRVQQQKSQVTDYIALFLSKLTVFKRLKNMFGGRIKMLISGSAPIRMETLDIFELIGLPIQEAYGVSENVVPIAMNQAENYKKGSVGKPLSVNKVVIGAGNEILVKGYGVLSAYLSVKNDAAVSDQGYLHTGDIGNLDEDGFLFIQGRQSEFLKLPNGKKVFPKIIESILEESVKVNQAFVTSDDRGGLVALVSFKTDTWEILEEDYLNELKRVCNARLKKYEYIDRIVSLPEQLSVENGELTSTQKYKRFFIKSKYHELINGVGVTS